MIVILTISNNDIEGDYWKWIDSLHLVGFPPCGNCQQLHIHHGYDDNDDNDANDSDDDDHYHSSYKSQPPQPAVVYFFRARVNLA